MGLGTDLAISGAFIITLIQTVFSGTRNSRCTTIQCGLDGCRCDRDVVDQHEEIFENDDENKSNIPTINKVKSRE